MAEGVSTPAQSKFSSSTDLTVVWEEPVGNSLNKLSSEGEDKDVTVLYQRAPSADLTDTEEQISESSLCTYITLVREEHAADTAAKSSDIREDEDISILYERVRRAGSAGSLGSQVAHNSAIKECSSAKEITVDALRNENENENESVAEDTLYRFIENKVTSVQRDTKSERARNIQKAVAENIQYFLKEVGKLEPVFSVSELIQVGSYAEGTKINEPDEFDFLAVVDTLSKEGTVIISQNSWTTGSVSLILGDTSVSNELSKFCEKGELQCFQGTSVSKSFYGATKFGTTFIKAVGNTFKANVFEFDSSTKSRTLISPIDITFAGKLIIPPVNGISLLLRVVTFKTPNIFLEYELEGHKIDVDLSPAIRYHKIEDCINSEKCASPKLMEAIRQHGSVLLIGLEPSGFRITVTECEVKYMREIMRERHRLLYTFFKHICHLFGILKPFTSYMLKQICIHHDAKCDSDSETLASCLKKIIQDIATYCSKRRLPTVHNKDVDLFGTRAKSERVDWHLRLHFLIALRELQQSSYDISCTEGFEAVLNDAVSKLSNKFSDCLNKEIGIENMVSSSYAKEDRLHCELCDNEQTVKTVSFKFFVQIQCSSLLNQIRPLKGASLISVCTVCHLSFVMRKSGFGVSN